MRTSSSRAVPITLSVKRRQRSDGSIALEHHQVALGARHLGGRELVLGPVDLARAALGQAHGGADRGEVVVLLGVDPGHVRRLEGAADERERRRRGLARVVPALERAHHHRLRAARVAAPRSGRSSRSRYPTSAPGFTIGAVTVAELRAGGEIEGVFACTRKDRLTARNGSPYLAVELRDRTGAIPGRAFRDADFLAGQFERGDLVDVRGPRRALPRRAAGRPGARSGAPRRARPTRPSSCRSPTATSTSSTASSSISAARSTTPTCARLLDSFLGDEGFRADFRRAPCTRGGHHAYLGGLLEHTVAVGDARARDEHAAPAPQQRPAPVRRDPARRREDPRVRARRRDRTDRGGRPRRPPRARRGDRERARRTACRAPSSTPSRTASSATTARTPSRAGAIARPRRSRSSA